MPHSDIRRHTLGCPRTVQAVPRHLVNEPSASLTGQGEHRCAHRVSSERRALVKAAQLRARAYECL